MPGLPKLTRPRTFGALRRERLFARLDQLRAAPVIWVAGPPGAGKTTLVAGWLEERAIPGIWYQVDTADTDCATFAWYLAQAAEPFASRKAPPLPLFAPEYHNDLEGFVRRYYRALFARMPVGSVLAFDNFQESRAGADVRAAFVRGMDEIPEGCNVVILSRGVPPPEFARLVASQRLARLEWDELRLTAEESRWVATARQPLDEATVSALHTLSGGWPAGLVLMREQAGATGMAPESVAGASEAVFDYFAGEIFSRTPPERQRLLALTSFFPRFTAGMAHSMLPDVDARRVLDGLYRRHLFVSRRGGAEGVYEYHALFRAFLRERAQLMLGREELVARRREAARLLEQGGLAGEALELYRESRDWAELVRVALDLAPRLLAQGRAKTLRVWLEAVPTGDPAAGPLLDYWLGVAATHVDPPLARACLTRACEAFAQCSDRLHEMLAAAAIIDVHYFEWADFRPIDCCISRLESTLREPVAWPDAATELKVRASLLIALLFRQPQHPGLAECAARVEALLDAPGEVNLRVAASSVLYNYSNWLTKGDSGQRLVAATRPLLDHPEVTPLNRAWWLLQHSFAQYVQGKYAEAVEVSAQVEAIAAENGLAGILFEIRHAEAMAAQAGGDLPAAEAAYARLAAALKPSRRMDVAYALNLRAGLEMLRGQDRQAVETAREAVRLAEQTGLPEGQQPHFIARMANAQIRSGQLEAALESYARACRLAVGVDRRHFSLAARLLRARLALGRGEAEARELLREAFAGCREAGYFNAFRMIPGLLAELAAAALEAGVEPEFTRALIARRGLSAPSRELEAWPWPLRVYTLGRFSVVRDGQPLAFTGKAQKKPLELLKALIALGGREVDSGTLITHLWPEAEGDDGKSSFDSNLYRLRKLLGVETALTLNDGKLTLDAEQCWVDLWAAERLLNRLENTTRQPAATGDLAAEASRLLATYRGHFLDREAPQPWLMATRDRLQARFRRVVSSLGRRLEEAGRVEEAIHLYQRTLELDNLAEEIYRSLMSCQLRRGQRAEALGTYRRCREMLSIVLGLTPSAETEALRAQLVE